MIDNDNYKPQYFIYDPYTENYQAQLYYYDPYDMIPDQDENGNYMKVNGSYYDDSHVLYDYSADGYTMLNNAYDYGVNGSSSYDYDTYADAEKQYSNTTFNYYYYA